MSMTREQQQVLEERYGDEDRPAGILWNETVQALMNHRTVRCFLPDALPTGALETRWRPLRPRRIRRTCISGA